MSPLLQSLVLGGLISGADYSSTRYGLAHGGVEGELLKQREIATAAQFAIVAGTDHLIQKKAPRLKWPYRVAVGAAMGLVVRNNMKDRRGQ